MIWKIKEQPVPEKTFVLVFDQSTQRWLIIQVLDMNGKFFMTDHNVIYGYDLNRFTHWTNIPEAPSGN